MFKLDPVLAADTWYIGDFPLCALLMSRDANYPWFILVPRLENITEIYQLDDARRQQLLAESCILSEQLQSQYNGDKLNVAALGNVVAQLHLHHIVRFRNDPAWPAPIWGAVAPREFKNSASVERIEALAEALHEFEFSATNVSGQ